MNGGIINRTNTILKLLRFPNLLFLSYLQVSFFFIFFSDSLSTEISLSQYLVGMLLPTISLAAFGNVVNDYFDSVGDLTNAKRPLGKGLITPDEVKNILVVTIVTACASILLSTFFLESWLFGLLLLVIGALLFSYSYKLKCLPFIGNLLVGVLCVLSVYLPFIFFKLKGIDFKLSPDIQSFMTYYAVFIFSFTFIREILKDLEDMQGDQKQKCNTAAVKYGETTTRKVVGIIMLLNLLFLAYWIINSKLSMGIMITAFSALPFVIFIALFTRTRDYQKHSTFIKFQMLMATLLIFAFKLL